MANSIRTRLWPSTYLAGAVLLASALLPLPRHDAIAGLPSVCLFHNFTGLPCPGCGLTRSWVSMAHGHFGEALVWHPLGPLMFVATLLYALWSVGIALQRPPFAMPRKLQSAAIVAFSLLLLSFWAARLAGVFPLPGG